MNLIPGADIRLDEPLRLHTTFRIGGPAELFLNASSRDEIRAALSFCAEKNVPVTLIGNGSNTLASDAGVRGVVLRVGDRIAVCSLTGNRLTAGAGALLPRLSRLACENGLKGLEWAAGIPGALGGAVCMNAGAYGGEMSAVVSAVDALASDGAQVRLTRDDLRFAYRHSRVMDEGLIILSAELDLSPAPPEELLALASDYSRSRAEKQPLTLPSAGSAFKRPKDGYAARLIDDAGLKGLRVGGAQVSEKHAGFIVNTGGATAADVLGLMDEVRARVLAAAGVELESEIRFIG